MASSECSEIDARNGGESVWSSDCSCGECICIAVDCFYIVANISGGHINLAVTFAKAVGGHIIVLTALFYWVSQMLASVMACLVLKVTTAGQVASILEALLKFTLVYTVYVARDPKRGALGSIGPLAIRMIAGANVLATGPFSGGSMNPASANAPVLEPGVEDRSLQSPSLLEPPQQLPPDDAGEPPVVAGLHIGTIAATDLIDGADLRIRNHKVCSLNNEKIESQGLISIEPFGNENSASSNLKVATGFPVTFNEVSSCDLQ
ncbi:hypothetical protein LWI28_010558 [Acer negundo]|uniref:Uncharacterized protein n=1 Tax=Acer negundo TaxID=4023 RepID=A0AAD5NIC1_ACENE|nr:hypothetical protein LWI28_010558 [Acer negundo]